MEEQETAESRSHLSSPSAISDSLATFVVPNPLKFLISNLRTLVPTQLTSENYSIWRLQLLQHFSANGFAGHLTGDIPSPSDSSSKDFHLWRIIDRNLVSAIFFTISPAILPYVLSLSTAHDIWSVLERRLQPTNRSRVIQLKNELHHIQMNNSSMQQYLTQIKILVDNIAASGSKLDTEDLVLHILNDLPFSYNSFKTAIISIIASSLSIACAACRAKGSHRIL